jgi:hypothetical protein
VVDGVFGVFELPSGPFIAVITDSEERYRGYGMEYRCASKHCCCVVPCA